MKEVHYATHSSVEEYVLASLCYRVLRGGNPAYYRVSSYMPNALNFPSDGPEDPDPAFRVLFKDPHKSQTLQSGALGFVIVAG